MILLFIFFGRWCESTVQKIFNETCFPLFLYYWLFTFLRAYLSCLIWKNRQQRHCNSMQQLKSAQVVQRRMALFAFPFDCLSAAMWCLLKILARWINRLIFVGKSFLLLTLVWWLFLDDETELNRGQWTSLSILYKKAKKLVFDFNLGCHECKASVSSHKD